MLVIFLIKEKGYGIYALTWLQLKNKAEKSNYTENQPAVNSRREALKNLATIPALGVIGLGAFRESREIGVDTLSGATIQIGGADIKELKGELPKGKIGEHEFSRLILGGNLIGGWAHSRDLIYVPSLFRAYSTEKKIFETLILAEKAGINAINIGFPTKVVTQCINFCRNSIIQKLFQKVIQRNIVFLKCSVNSARLANTRIFPDKNFAHTFALLFIPVPPCCFFSSLSPKLT